MILEIIKISAAIILGTVALGIILFFFYFIWNLIEGLIIGIKEGYRQALHENGVYSFKELIEKKKKENESKRTN
jgi:hypothetical protein